MRTPSALYTCHRAFHLQYAKEILCDPEKRSNYDKWRHSGIAISYKQWLGMKDHVHQVSPGRTCRAPRKKAAALLTRIPIDPFRLARAVAQFPPAKRGCTLSTGAVADGQQLAAPVCFFSGAALEIGERSGDVSPRIGLMPIIFPAGHALYKIH